mmetsp:Transcript_24510/g.41668  ORF Transcript_24510/g.41668 Transcript_24510/m.41668 type:complete len:99 (-) Transcript_24510:1023-1319(-)
MNARTCNPLSFLLHQAFCLLPLPRVAIHVIPASVTTIEHSAFYQCCKLQFIAIPASVTTIENQAFSGCSMLNCAVILSSVFTAGISAFEGCMNLPFLR